MLKNLSSLKQVIAEKDFTLLCDQDSPVEHVMHFAQNVVEYCKKIIEAAQQAVPVVEEVVEDLQEVKE